MLLWFWSQSLQQAVADLLSVNLSWMTDLLQEFLRRCQEQAAVLETNVPTLVMASEELQAAPSSCPEQQYSLQFSWSAVPSGIQS